MERWIMELMFLFLKILLISHSLPSAEAYPDPNLNIHIHIEVGGEIRTPSPTSKPLPPSTTTEEPGEIRTPSHASKPLPPSTTTKEPGEIRTPSPTSKPLPPSTTTEEPDETVTELPTCRGNSRCTGPDGCPGNNFKNNKVCRNPPKYNICNIDKQAISFVEELEDLGTENILSYPVFGKDGYGSPIDYIRNGDTCKFVNPVKTWICKRDNKVWTCIDNKEFCTVESNYHTGNIISRYCQCPVEDIITKYVPKDCTTDKEAWDFFKNKLSGDPMKTTPYPVFGAKAFDNSMIEFKKDDIDQTLCINVKPVNMWICKLFQGKWDKDNSCTLQGFCTAKSSVDKKGSYVDGSIKCPCANPNFKEKHVCPECHTGAQALTHTNTNRDSKDKDPNTVLAAQPEFIYDLIEDSVTKRKICKITSPKSVMAWQVSKTGKVWDKVEALMECNNLQSALDSGHFFFEKKECIKYKKHPGNKWATNCQTLPTIVGNGTPENCMKKCTKETKCNAFNYKIGAVCNLMLCDIRYPDPTSNADYSAYYYSFQGSEYEEHVENIWNVDCTTLQSIKTSEPLAYCMQKCTQNLGCNAFNYKSGDICILMACDIKYPALTSNTEYSAYYLFPGPLTV